MRFEEGVREELDAIGREAMKRAFAAADFNDSEVWSATLYRVPQVVMARYKVRRTSRARRHTTGHTILA